MSDSTQSKTQYDPDCFWYNHKEAILYFRHNGLRMTIEIDKTTRLPNAENVMQKLWDISQTAKREEYFPGIKKSGRCF